MCASTAAAVSVGGLAPAHALDLDGNADLITETVAEQERRRAWDPAKLYGARPVAEIDRTFAQPDGVRVGNFFLYPSISETAEYDTNIFGSGQDATPDWRFITEPTLTIQSRLPRHVLDVTLGGKFVNYADHSDQDYASFGGIVRGALHLDNAHTLSATLHSAKEHEERSAGTAPRDAAEPVPFVRNRAAVGITRDVGRLYGTLAATAETLEYDSIRALDGSHLSQSSRDQTLYGGQLRTGYRLSPGYEIVSKVRVGRQLNEGEVPGAADRDSTAYEGMAGLQFETDPLLSWRLLGGYGVRDYDRADLSTVQTGLLEARVRWLPSERLTLYGNAGRVLVDEIGAADNGRIETFAGARAEYELRHDLTGHVSADYADQEFLGSDRSDQVLELGIGLDYHHTKNWLFSLGYTYENRSSNEAEYDFDRNRFRVGGKLKF